MVSVAATRSERRRFMMIFLGEGILLGNQELLGDEPKWSGLFQGS